MYAFGGMNRPSAADRSMNDPFMSHSAAPTRTTPAPSGPVLKPKPSAPTGPSLLTIVVALLCSPGLGLFLLTAAAYAAFWQATSIPIVVSLVGLSATVMEHSGRGGMLYVVTGMLGVASGAMTGIYSHEAYIGPFLAISQGREYHDVIASSPAAAYADAGKIMFAESSVVDTSRSVGYRDRRTFCVAPVVDSGNSQDRTIHFWAVGLDCCNARGDFECGAADLYGSRGGVRLAPEGLLENPYEDFKQAVLQAGAVYDLHVEDEPIMVRWVEDPKVEQVKLLLGASGVLALGTACYVMLMIAAAGTSYLLSTGE